MDLYTIKETRTFLEFILKSGGGLYDLTASVKRFEDGGQYCFEVPDIQGLGLMKTFLEALLIKMKERLLIILLSLFCLAVAGQNNQNNGTLQGDVNGDSKVNVADVTELVNINNQNTSTLKGDVNGDGIVNVADITDLVNIILVNSDNSDSSEIGIENAVKKARQMTDLLFTPKNPIEYNTGTYQPGITYKGLIYSSVKETDTFVGECVSFHTFITAVKNSKSKLYTERVDQYPYHGVNCKAYYGTVCSGLVSYALGLVPRYATFDFPESDLMDIVDYSLPENLQIADVLWRDGHVALITDILTDDSNIISTIEISESPSSNCKRYNVTRDHFLNTIMTKNFSRVYRYREIEKNVSFTPISEDDISNDDNLLICVDKGDKSCYLEGEDVVINILDEDCDSLVIYKDNIIFKTYSPKQDKNIVLKDLTYGDYMAQIIKKESTGMNPPKMTRGEDLSDCKTYWIIVNTEIKYDMNNSKLFFSSLNAKPLYAICCKENGSRPHLKNGFYHIFSEDEINAGYINVDREKLNESYPYMKLFFETDYGAIINTPINCFE